MAEETFTPGDVVYLKSGGPAMTINLVDEYGYANCVWFTKERTVMRENFPVTSITKFNPE